MVTGVRSLVELALWFTLAFFSGAIPFSVLIGSLALDEDIRTYGDHNPGATNVIRAGGVKWGVIAILLDFFKAALPIGLAYWIADIDNWRMIPVGVAPVLGHAFSPFLKFRGGKAVASTFGIWAGLTLGEGPILLGIFLGFAYLLVSIDGWAVMLMFLGLGAHLALNHADPVLLGVWVANVAISAWKHGADLRKMPGLRPTLHHLLKKLGRRL